MAILRKMARPLLASAYVTSGYETLRHPEAVTPTAEPVAVPVAERVPALPMDAEQLVRTNSAVQVGVAVLFALGRFPRLSAFALAATLVPTMLAGHRYRKLDDPQERSEQQIQFYKNMSMPGGLLIAGRRHLWEAFGGLPVPARGRRRPPQRSEGPAGRRRGAVAPARGTA